MAASVVELACVPGAIASVPAYPTISNCFTLHGAYTNGTSLGFLNVGDENSGTWAAVVSGALSATKLSIDTSTGAMVDYQGGGDPYQGFLASADWAGQSPWGDGRIVSGHLYFDSRLDLQDQEMAEHIALDCELDSDSVLACENPNNAGYDIFQFCTRYDMGLMIGNGLNPNYDCEAIKLTATAAQDCAPPTSTPTITPTPTQTTTTLPTGTTTPKRFLCSGTETLCVDNFLVKCSKLPYNTTISWYIVRSPPITSELQCHQACVNDAACGAWRYYEEFIDLLNCYHTHDTISSSTRFRFEYYFDSVGVRGACQ